MNKLLTVSFLVLITLNSTVFAAGSDSNEQFDDLHKLTTEKAAVDNVPTAKLSKRAFEALLEEMYPTTPEQLNLLQEREKELTNTFYDNKPPKALTNIIDVSTKPGSIPVTIYVAPFHTTTLNIIDSTGQPWPIAAVMYGNDSDYKVSKIDSHKYLNIVRIDPKREVGTTNINLSLADLPTTITVTLKNSTDQYYPSPILQIDKEGPQAMPEPVFSVDNINSDNVLKNIVLGNAPDNFKAQETSDENVEAWTNDGNLYIRTIYRPSSPLPRGIHHGPSNYAAYRMNDIPVLVMTTVDGHEKKIMIKARN